MELIRLDIQSVSCVIAAFSAWCAFRAARAAEKAVRRLEARDIPSFTLEPDRCLGGIRIVNIGHATITVVEAGHVVAGCLQPASIQGHKTGTGLVDVIARTLRSGEHYTIPTFPLAPGDEIYAKLATGQVIRIQIPDVACDADGNHPDSDHG